MNSSEISKFTLLSDSSDNNKNNSYNKMYGGDSKTQDKYMSMMILDAFNTKNYQAASFTLINSLNKNINICFYTTDNTGKTILHHLVLCSNESSELYDFLITVIKNVHIDINVNASDNIGNTACHYAMYLKMNTIIDLLVNIRNADLTIKNNEGLSIAPILNETDTELSEIAIKNNNLDNTRDVLDLSNNVIVLDLSNRTSETSDYIPSEIIETEQLNNFTSGTNMKSKFNNINDNIDNIVNEFVLMTPNTDNNSNTDNNIDTSTIGFNRDNLTDTMQSTEHNANQFNTRALSSNGVKIIGTETDNATSDFVDNAFMNDVFRNTGVEQTGGKSKKQSSKTSKTSKTSNSTKGVRRMFVFSEMTGGVSDTDSDNAKKYSRDIKKKQNKESSDIHKRSIEKIQKIMNVDLLVARAYKSIIYDKIKQEMPELNNLDRSNELEKRSSDESYLKSINKNDIKKRVEIIKQKDLDRELKMSSESDTKMKKKK